MARREPEDQSPRRYYIPPATIFVHRAYRSAEQYPRGAADVAGYWAEGRIFGGVVWFERGETDREVCHYPPSLLLIVASGSDRLSSAMVYGFTAPA